MWFRFSLLFAMAALLACAAAPNQSPPGASDSKVRLDRPAKIEQRLQRIADKLAVLTATSEFLPEHSLSSLSTPTIRIDDAGNIQCYIYLTALTDSTLAALNPHVSTVETMNRELAILQAWILQSNLGEIAQFDFVLKITAPDYAIIQPAAK